MIFVIDNYDSFTFNLVQYLAELGARVKVHRNDAIDVPAIRRAAPSGLLISPGPCTPNEAGISLQAVQELSGHLPILGVCLGHQSIGQVFGGEVVRAPRIMHGKTSLIHHAGSGVFAGMPRPFTATRYHSLVVRAESVPDVLEVTAHTDDGLVMGLKHRTHPTEGVQFHPESVLTMNGHQLLANWLRQCGLEPRLDRVRPPLTDPGVEPGALVGEAA